MTPWDRSPYAIYNQNVKKTKTFELPHKIRPELETST